MTPDQKAALDRLIEVRRRQNAALGDELRKLLEQPELYDVATHLADALLGAVDHLCNFEYAVTHGGEKVDTVDVMTTLKDHVGEEFKRLTGRDYVPRICRRIDHHEKGNQT
jgi:hypothetical protein